MGRPTLDMSDSWVKRRSFHVLIERKRFGQWNSKDELGLSLTSPSLREHPVFSERRPEISLRFAGYKQRTKFTGCQKIGLQSSLNLRKRLASDHLFRISTSVFPPPETTVKLSFVSKCSHLRFRSWRFDNILSSLPTSIFQCHHSWSSSSNLCHHYSVTKLFTLANLQNNYHDQTSTELPTSGQNSLVLCRYCGLSYAVSKIITRDIMFVFLNKLF